MLLIVSMGIPASNYRTAKEGFRYSGAIIQIIDWERKKIVKEISYTSPPEHLGEGLSMQFKGATIFNDEYYVVTNTEIIEYDLATWTLERVASDKTFNDLHGLMVTDDSIYLCNTGLEMIQVLNHDFEIIEEINLASKPTWTRFDKDTDYRKLATTKPHEIHVNHAFMIHDNLWVTRLHKFDAANALDPSEKISLRSDAGCHDGIVQGGSIYFTSVNGHILKVDMEKREVVQDIDIGNLVKGPLGWTRGLEVVGNQAFVATTALRHSRFKRYLKWITDPKSEGKIPSTIFQIDLSKEVVVDSYEIGTYTAAAVYTILKHPDSDS
ncbi:MAG: hypothetical protein JRJ35_07320 [Deltaproteobacteria bacterium]|nr:hypothetical protein [Deltaproteobacteria bacterium]MBW1932251.1 hypothetical protein [Deltaproteobacteria bacterium]